MRRIEKPWPGVGGWGTARAGQPMWAVEEVVGEAAELHRVLPPPDRRTVRVFEVNAPAIVLGSTQQISDVVAEQADVPVVRRRSGGGAVWVEPGDPVWVDAFVPAGDELWEQDVGRAFWWLGDCWALALAAAGIEGAVVHRGALVRSRWSAAVCFAGLGPGEVTVGGRKIVGIAQRRQREGALFQCAVPRRWSPGPLVDALGIPEAAAELRDVAAGVSDAELLPAFLAHLP